MVKHTKAKKSLKGLGARYGIKLRKQYTKIHFQLKEKRSGRDAVGIWSCKKCDFKIAGTAYDIKL